MHGFNPVKIKEWGSLTCLAVLGMVVALALFSNVRFAVSAFEVAVQLVPFRSGDTVIFIPPVGELSAATHWLPLQLKITLLNVDLELLVEGLESMAGVQNLAFLEDQLREKLTFFVLRTTGIVFLCGAGSVYFLARQRRLRRCLFGGLLAAALFMALFFGTLVLPYNIDAFNSPRYTGIIGAAPWVVNLSEQTMATITALGEQLEVMTANLHDLSEQLEQVQPAASQNGLRVLHVSDIHNNPAAFDFIEKVAGSFRIDLIIDTGDLTDYGTELESELVNRVVSLPVPYLFVPGNHDSPQAIEAMRREGIIVLENSMVEVEGLRVAGIADPSSAGPEMTIAPDYVLRRVAVEAKAALPGGEERPDVVAVHHPAMGLPFQGEVPVILSGHNHRASVNFEGDSTLINAGSTGAAGVRGLQAPRDNPYSMVVLYFNPSGEDRLSLAMADLLSVQQYQDSFTLKRYYKR